MRWLFASAMVASQCSSEPDQNSEPKPTLEVVEGPRQARVDRCPPGVSIHEANERFENGDYEGAQEVLDELERCAPRSGCGSLIKKELNVVGKDARALEVEKWFQGEASLGVGEATALVFWEAWCPHCEREVPKMEATFQKYKGRGFQVVGLTKMTRNITEAQVGDFLKENGISYPVAKEAGTAMSEHYGVKGIPAAAVVKGGKIVWRGHPARINDALIESWLD